MYVSVTAASRVVALLKVCLCLFVIVYLSSALYREVPTPAEVEGTANFYPKMADNAEALIDWALSHIPKRE